MEVRAFEYRKTKPTIKEPSDLELKSLPNHLKTPYLGRITLYPSLFLAIECHRRKVIMKMLERHTKVIGQNLETFKG